MRLMWNRGDLCPVIYKELSPMDEALCVLKAGRPFAETVCENHAVRYVVQVTSEMIMQHKLCATIVFGLSILVIRWEIHQNLDALRIHTTQVEVCWKRVCTIRTYGTSSRPSKVGNIE